MIDSLQNSAPIMATGLGESFQMNGIDLLTSIEMLLVKDYDNQMRSLGKQIKGSTKIKEAYRGQIEGYQNLLTRPTVKKGDDKKTESVAITASEYDQFLGVPKEYVYNLETNKVEERASTTLEPLKSLGNNLKTLQSEHKKKYAQVSVPKGPANTKALSKPPASPKTPTEYYVAKDAVNSMIDNVKLKLESLNEQSELNSLSLQSLTNQRKIAFETISNLVNKQHDSVATMVRNLKG